jgi:hypothetical protein
MPGRYQGLEFFQGPVIAALAMRDGALDGGEFSVIVEKNFARGDDCPVGGLQLDVAAPEIPDLGFGAAHAAEEPFVVDERVDEETLGGVSGRVAFVVLGSEGGEIFGGFREDNLGSGEDAVLERIETGVGAALGRAGAGGFLCIGAAGRGLLLGWYLNDLSTQRVPADFAANWILER